jgi:5-formyltetrahydrofolate cyclo-ligase
VATAAKAARRDRILAARRAVDPAVSDAEARALCEHLPAVVGSASVVCAYLPVGSEPGSPALVDRLDDLCETVLLPMARRDTRGTPLPLRWGRYVRGGLLTADLGLREPAGPSLAPETLSRAGVVLVPALAVDRRGVRLGRGGGFYDRSLPMCAPGTPLVAVVRDDELVDELPAGPHDVPMTHALTPAAGLVALGE